LILDIEGLEAGYDDALVLQGVSLRADAHGAMPLYVGYTRAASRETRWSVSAEWKLRGGRASAGAGDARGIRG